MSRRKFSQKIAKTAKKERTHASGLCVSSRMEFIVSFYREPTEHEDMFAHFGPSIFATFATFCSDTA